VSRNRLATVTRGSKFVFGSGSSCGRPPHAHGFTCGPPVRCSAMRSGNDCESQCDGTAGAIHLRRRGGPPAASSAKEQSQQRAGSGSTERAVAVSGLAGIARTRTRVRAPVISTTHQFERPASLELHPIFIFKRRRADSGQSESVAHPRRGRGKVRRPGSWLHPVQARRMRRADSHPSRGAGHRSSATSANTGGCPADVVRCRAGVLFIFCGAVAHLRHSRTADTPS